MNDPQPTAPARRTRGARVNPDQPWVAAGALVLTVIVMAAGMAFSYAAITEAASWSGNPEWARMLAAVMIDGCIIAFAVVRAVLLWRGIGARRTLAYLWLFTVVSVVVNFSHAASSWEWDFSKQEAWLGCLIAVAAPLVIVLTGEEIIRMVFGQHSRGDNLGAPAGEEQSAATTAADAAPAEPQAEEDTAPVDEPNAHPSTVDAEEASGTAPADAEGEPSVEVLPAWTPIFPRGGDWETIPQPDPSELELYEEVRA